MLYIAIGSIGNVGIEPANRATIQVWMANWMGRIVVSFF
jgi:hypothetical protein